MLIAHTADLHITERRDDSRATLEEQIEILRWIGEDAAAAGAELLVCAGDVFDAASTPLERRAAIDVVSAWADRLPVVIVQGNHDRPHDLYPLRRLRTRHPVVVASQPTIVKVADAAVACLPWPRKEHLVAQLAGASALEIDAALTDGLRAVLGGLRHDLAHTPAATRILLAHVELGGAALDSGQPVAARCAVRISEGDLLDVGADYVAAGHIHQHQVLADGLICYAGSPRQCTFGEDATKGYCLVDVEGDNQPAIEHRRGPGRELVTLEAVWVPEAGHISVDGDEPGAGPGAVAGEAFRIAYSVTEPNRAAAAKDADRYRDELLAAGAHSVKLDPRVVAVARVRSEEIRAARTTQDRLEAWWTARGQRPDRAPEILSKLSTLESEVAA